VASQGGSVVTGVIDTMGSINALFRRIVDILCVVGVLALQTTILAQRVVKVPTHGIGHCSAAAARHNTSA